jgi:hypothetical protein
VKGLNGCSEGMNSKSIALESVASTKFPNINRLIEKECVHHIYIHSYYFIILPH